MVGFIIIGNKNAVIDKVIFPHIKNNELWLGITNPDEYRLPNGGITQTVKGLCRWYTNLEHNRRNTELDLFKKYNETDYPKYDNYDAIEVSRTENIPMDYDGVMGVPITFLDKYCPTQFEIVGVAQGSEEIAGDYYLGIIPSIKYDGGKARAYVNGKSVYARILIRRKKAEPIAEVGKKFLIIGNQNAITYKEIFPYIKENKLWLGVSISSGDREFRIPDNYVVRSKSLRIDENGNKYVRVVGIRWFTNIPHDKRNAPLDLYKKYNEVEYPKYDNYDAINVNKTSDIPMDYDGIMGVPITFLDKYCPTQFEIVGWSRHNDLDMDGGYWLGGCNDATINSKLVYRRLLIRRI